MWINRIVISNLGSYEGKTSIPISSNTGRNIILIGGKNGAGKTTLFEAIRLCLYGYKAFGYEVMSFAYKQRINSMINDNAKQNENAIAYVLIDMDVDDGQNKNNYVIKRSWSKTYSSFEILEINKNGSELDSDSIEDFNNFFLSLIPPELFDLYFFDGERIAEYFLDDSSGDKLKSAFLTLCGYDTLSIILDNFYRLVKTKKTRNAVSEYLLVKEKYLKDKNYADSLVEEKEKNAKQIHDFEIALDSLETEYRKKGGVTEEEWNEITSLIKEQEKYRESLNAEIKSLANNVIPFFILRDEICGLRDQIDIEDRNGLDGNTKEKLKTMLPSLVENSLSKAGLLYSDEQLSEVYNGVLGSLFNSDGDTSSILSLALSERDMLLSQIASLLSLDKETVLANRKELNASIRKTKKLREELGNSSIEFIKAFDEKKNFIRVQLASLEEDLQRIEEEVSESVSRLELSEVEFEKATKAMEAELKHNSVIDLSSKSAVLIENLLSMLVETKVKQVEQSFINKINQLKQKESFISRISIDSQFFIHAYKKVDSGENGVREEEIDKSRLSKGEKQVFIMALYWALISLSNTSIPFIIDTPFARIDSEHREKITEYFFKELPGQVFLFSTDEEIVDSNLHILTDKIGMKMLLENKSNIRTSILLGEYFSE